jgi:hypothetical protein
MQWTASATLVSGQSQSLSQPVYQSRRNLVRQMHMPLAWIRKGGDRSRSVDGIIGMVELNYSNKDSEYLNEVSICY